MSDVSRDIVKAFRVSEGTLFGNKRSKFTNSPFLIFSKMVADIGGKTGFDETVSSDDGTLRSCNGFWLLTAGAEREGNELLLSKALMAVDTSRRIVSAMDGVKTGFVFVELGIEVPPEAGVKTEFEAIEEEEVREAEGGLQ